MTKAMIDNSKLPEPLLGQLVHSQAPHGASIKDVDGHFAHGESLQIMDLLKAYTSDVAQEPIIIKANL